MSPQNPHVSLDSSNDFHHRFKSLGGLHWFDLGRNQMATRVRGGWISTSTDMVLSGEDDWLPSLWIRLWCKNYFGVRACLPAPANIFQDCQNDLGCMFARSLSLPPLTLSGLQILVPQLQHRWIITPQERRLGTTHPSKSRSWNLRILDPVY